MELDRDSGFATYPKVLAVAVGRFIIENWVPSKTSTYPHSSLCSWALQVHLHVHVHG